MLLHVSALFLHWRVLIVHTCIEPLVMRVWLRIREIVSALNGLTSIFAAVRLCCVTCPGSERIAAVMLGGLRTPFEEHPALACASDSQ
jgi:hypothetical protein